MGKGLKNQRMEVQTGVKNTRRRRGTFSAQGAQSRTPGNMTVNTPAGRITGSGPIVQRSVTRVNPVTGQRVTITGGQAVQPTAAVNGRQIKGSGNRNTKPNPTRKKKKK